MSISSAGLCAIYECDLHDGHDERWNGSDTKLTYTSTAIKRLILRVKLFCHCKYSCRINHLHVLIPTPKVVPIQRWQTPAQLSGTCPVQNANTPITLFKLTATAAVSLPPATRKANGTLIELVLVLLDLAQLHRAQEIPARPRAIPKLHCAL